MTLICRRDVFTRAGFFGEQRILQVRGLCAGAGEISKARFGLARLGWSWDVVTVGGDAREFSARRLPEIFDTLICPFLACFFPLCLMSALVVVLVAYDNSVFAFPCINIFLSLRYQQEKIPSVSTICHNKSLLSSCFQIVCTFLDLRKVD